VTLSRTSNRFGLYYLNRDAGIISGAWVQGQYRPVRAGVSCVAVRSGPHVLSTHRDKVADLHSGFI
jgi:hypothetical protein